MSPRVSISLKAAQRLVSEHLQGGCCKACDAPVAELRAAIAKATRASATRRKLKQPKAEKRATKRDETSALRVMALARAGNRCEASDCRAEPGTAPALYRPLEMDHFFGRGHVAQELATVWILCARCHRAKTDNNPTSQPWLLEFIRHCTAHGYSAEAHRAHQRLAWVESKARAAP